MKKKLLILVALLVLLAIGGGLFVGFGLDGVAKKAVEAGGTAALGKPVTLESATLRPFSGKVALEGLVLPNADGFEEPEFLSAGKVAVEMKPLSLLADAIDVPEIVIEAPKITLEVNLNGSNLGAIRKHLEGQAKQAESPSEDREAEPAAKGDGEPLRLRVGRIRITRGTVVLAQTAFDAKREEHVLEEFVIENVETKDAEQVTTLPRLLQRIVTGVLEQVAKKNDSFPPEVLEILEKHDIPALGDVQKTIEENVPGDLKDLPGNLLEGTPTKSLDDAKKGLEGLIPGRKK